MMFASESSGRAPRTAGSREVIFAVMIAATATFSIAALPAASTGSIAFGRMVITGIPFTICECTSVEPPNTDCVLTSSGVNAIASVMMPDSRRTANRPAISFPRAVDGRRITFAPCDFARSASAIAIAELG
ncbi:unannotated protein [freshwater metagenome]|uniref:Unannotated protein n=1 Tax=freshwater metagenome TaxID=449393 RepID=A0A6J6CAM5_9ZZZZ